MITSLAAAALAASAALLASPASTPQPLSTCMPIPSHAQLCLEDVGGYAQPFTRMKGENGTVSGIIILAKGTQFDVEGIGCTGGKGSGCTWDNLRIKLGHDPVCTVFITAKHSYGPVCLKYREDHATA